MAVASSTTFGAFVHEDRLVEEAVRPARVDGDLDIRHRPHRGGMGGGDAFGQVAVRAPRIDPVHVVAEGVERVAPLRRLEGGRVHHGAEHQRALQLGGVHLAQRDLAGERAFGLVPVDRAVDPEHAARLGAVDDGHGDLQRRAAAQRGDGDDPLGDGAGRGGGGADGDGCHLRSP
jgi:hypothetical protein